MDLYIKSGIHGFIHENMDTWIYRKMETRIYFYFVLGSACSEDTLALYGLCLDKSAQFYLGQGRLEQAESGFRSAVLLSSRIHGEEHEQTLVINNSLASVLRDSI